jgi:hypothetical protein
MHVSERHLTCLLTMDEQDDRPRLSNVGCRIVRQGREDASGQRWPELVSSPLPAALETNKHRACFPARVIQDA